MKALAAVVKSQKENRRGQEGDSCSICPSYRNAMRLIARGSHTQGHNGHVSGHSAERCYMLGAELD